MCPRWCSKHIVKKLFETSVNFKLRLKNFSTTFEVDIAPDPSSHKIKIPIAPIKNMTIKGVVVNKHSSIFLRKINS